MASGPTQCPPHGLPSHPLTHSKQRTGRWRARRAESLQRRWCVLSARRRSKTKGRARFQARPRPRRSHPATPGSPQPQPRVLQPKEPPPKPQARRRTREGSSEVGGVLSARRRSKTKGRELASKRAQGLGAHTPLPHASHNLSLECPSQRNRHPSPRLAAERAREALKSVVCFRRAPAFENEGERARFQARPRPRRSHPATPRIPQPQPRVPQPTEPPPKP